jgi:hypothetical protein
MLRDAVDLCPEDVWVDGEHTNAFWQIAYHALYFTHLYLQPSLDAFVPWAEHQSDVQHPDGIAGPADPESELPLIPEPYTKGQVLAYCDVCDEMVDGAVQALDLGSEGSGFDWYPIPKLEHQMVSLRHLQHHAAQLADRLRNQAGIGIDWVGSRCTGG